MADEIKTITRQNTYTSTPEGSLGFMRLNPIGNLCIADPFMQLVFDGRVFNASNAAQETLEDISENGRGTHNINPALLLDIPTDKTAIPLEILVDQGAAGTSQDMAFTIVTDDAVRYLSGGVAITPINMRKDNIRTSSCLFKSGSTTIVATTHTDDDTLYSCWSPAEATPKTTTGTPTLLWTARVNVPPILIGPASLLVFIVSAAADPTYMWSVKWAEFDTKDIIKG